VVLGVGLTVVVSLVASSFIQRYVGSWLEMRTAYRNLSSSDYGQRMESISLLRRSGEETESELIALLHHPDEGVRDFAASELAMRTPVTDDIVEAFFVALDNNQHVSEIGRFAPALFSRHSENVTGSLSDTERRMIAWLKAELNSTNPDLSGHAAWGLTAFVNRDPSLREPLAAYLKTGTFFYRYLTLRELVNRDPSMTDEYIELLFSGLGSSNSADQGNAVYGLTHLKSEPSDLRSRLEARRTESTDPAEISKIDETLETLRRNDGERP
jgi:hypothetical protein